MFSVTSDIQAGTSFQIPAPRSSRSDVSKLPDSFSALVDAATPPDSSTSSLPAPSAPAPRASTATAGPSRDAARSTDSDRTSQTPSQDKPAGETQQTNGSDKPASDASSVSASDKTDKSGKSGSDTAGTAGDKPAGKTGSGQDGKDAAAAAAAPSDPTAAVPIPVAVAVQPGVPLAMSEPTASSGGNDTALPAAQVAALATVAAPATITDANVAVGNDAKTGLIAAPGKSAGTKTPEEAVPANAAGSAVVTPTSADNAPAADATFVAALDAALPGNAKPTGKTAAQEKTGLINGETVKTPEQGSTATQGAQPDKGGLAQQPTAAAKPDSGELGDIGKSNDKSAAPAAHEHGVAPANTQANLPVTDPANQVTAASQPQLAPPTSAAAPITSANLTATAATAATVPLHGVAIELAASVLNGKSRFELRLDPAELGRIDVRIDIDRNGQVTSHLRVEKPETLAMLQQTAPQLQQALQDAGVKTGNSTLQFSLRDQNSSSQNGGDNQQPSGNSQRLIVTEDETVPAQLAGRSYGRMFGGQGGVDIRV